MVFRSQSVNGSRELARVNIQSLRRTAEPPGRLALVIASDREPQDDLARPVYCILGMPIDAVEMDDALIRIAAAVQSRKRLLLSTPNMNFLAQSLADSTFRESLLASDLSTADGTPIVWLARMLGIPIRSRVAGSDLFAQLKLARLQPRKLSVFFFGGAGEAGRAACESLNASASAMMMCAGCLNPGHGSVATMGSGKTISAINASGADILCVALGAAKGQAWLLENDQRIKIPVRAHLGAVVNFQAGTARRAPVALQKLGLEWLWRIKEEPYLWRRYGSDGVLLLRLLMRNVLPLAIETRWQRVFRRGSGGGFVIEPLLAHETVRLVMIGAASARHVALATTHFREAVGLGRAHTIIDLSRVSSIDARFIGALMMLRKCLRERNARLEIVGASRALQRLFKLHAASYLLGNERYN